jgi:hypothetical protein
MAKYSINFHISAKQAGRAQFHLLWRQQSVYIISSVLVFLLGICILPINEVRPLASFGFGAIFVFWYIWIQSLYRARKIFARIEDSEIKVSLEEECITITSKDGTASLRWSAFSQLYRGKKFLILISRSAGYGLIPTQSLPPEARAYLELKLKEAHARIQ